MAELVWVHDTKPDRPGIWLRKSDVNGSMHTVNVYETNLDSQPFGTYCFFAEWPTIADPPRYRDVTAADVGEMVEVCAKDGIWWERKLVEVKQTITFVAESPSGEKFEWKHARILDSEPAKQPREPREVWIPCCGETTSCLNYNSHGEAMRAQSEDWTAVRFVEDIE